MTILNIAGFDCLSSFVKQKYRVYTKAGLVFGMMIISSASAALNLSQSPLFLTQGQPPLVLLTMARDHKLFYEAYNDYSDLDGDGSLDVGYKPSIDYYGYFDSYKCYTYNAGNGRFEPSSVSLNKKCSGLWSGDFLNYVTMARIDALRKVLYGGFRSTDTSSATVLERTFIPQDAHSWGKEYQSIARDGYDIREYTPLSLPDAGRYHLFANTTLTSAASPPLMRVLTNSSFRVWEWLSIERPVAGTQCATGNNVRTNCVVPGGTFWEVVPASNFIGLTQTVYYTGNYSGSPSNQSNYDSLVSSYADTSNLCGTRSIDKISGSGNPFQNQGNCPNNSDKYLNIFKGKLVVPTTGTYKFAVDGDDAVDVFINSGSSSTPSGVPVASWYGGHGSCGGCGDHFGAITLTAGVEYDIVFRHQEASGGDNYYLYWERTVPTSAMTDYNVRVEVCNQTVGLEANCATYGSSNKPVGLLQKQGENNGMYFGLLTGSYAHNTQGGVLRKAMSSINNEITADGRFGTTAETCLSGSNCVKGIISTINSLKITGFSYADHTYSCGWKTTSQMIDGECEMWGNPIGEMVYEGLRYFSGKTSATNDFTYDSTNSSLPDNILGLPQLKTWTNPYVTGNATPAPTASTATFASCSKPYMMLVSDVYPSFDSDKMPGSAFSSFTGDLSGLNVNTLGQTMWATELGGARNIFIGHSASNYDGAPTAKSANSFGNIRGLAPGEPTREGTFYAAAAAYYGHITDLNAASGQQRLNTYSIALAAPLPKLEIPVGGNKVTILPFAKSVKGSSISATQGSFQPTNQIVDLYVDTIRNVPGSPTDNSINGGRAYYKFRINYEDVEQGADHDMDAVALYEIKLNADNTISVSVSSDYAAGGITQHMGFVISGTTRDGAYLVVRDSDTDAGNDQVYFLDCRSASTDPADCTTGSGALPLYKQLTFSSSATGSATLLKDPLWYAAKWGGFIDDNNNQLPDTTEWSANWSANADNTPDNYFLVTNPLNLETQLTKAFAKIKNDSATAAATSTNSFSYQSDSALYQARFSSDGWQGELNAYPVNADGSLGTPLWQAQYKLAAQAGREILTYDPDATVKGIPFRWSNMTSSGTSPYLRTSLNKNYAGTVDSKGEDRVSFLRGNSVTDMRTRPYIKGTSITNKLGDIVSSQPQYVAMPNFGYAQDTYADFRTDKENRAPMIYIGANDGMLHGFSGEDGTEKIAYIPSEMYRTRNGQVLLSKLTESNYGKSGNAHNYYVDGSPTVGDVCTTTCASKTDWKTILVGGLNGGGQGIYALNINNPANFSETNASSLVMWEFTDRQDTASADPTDNSADSNKAYGLGYTYSRPAIARICTERVNGSSTTPKACADNKGRWVVIFGNGYNNTEADGYASTSGHAMLYILDALTGSVIRKINTKVGSAANPNGLATPAVVDVDGDDYADYVYAGDLQGNLWKFDLTSDTYANWEIAFGNAANPAPLYTAKSDSGSPAVAKPITTAPEAILHPEQGVLVMFGTGSYITTSDNGDNSRQSIYGIWDNGAAVTSTNHSNLQLQTATTASATYNSDEYRKISSNTVDWSTKKGWYMNLPDTGERVSYDPRVFGKILSFTSTVPSGDICDYGGWSWDYFIDATTGGALPYSAYVGVPSLTFGDTTGYASGRKTKVGITPPGTLITQGRGRGTNIECGSTGNCDDYDVNLGSNTSGRLSWREIIKD